MSRDTDLRLGLEHHCAGRLDEAAEIYRALLDRDEADAHARHLLGAVMLQKGDADTAIALMTRAVEDVPGEPRFHYNLGNAHKDRGDLAEAVACYAAAIALAPRYTDAHNNRGTALKNLGRLDEAAACFRAAIESDPSFANGHKNLASVLNDLGRTEEALAAYRRTVELDPSNMSARHMAAALAGETTAGAPAGYIRELFDGYAARFDDHLVNDLGYAVPGALRRALGRLPRAVAGFGRVLDLGCGTGLVAEAVRDIAGEIHGVDLSPHMVERARAKGVYARLETDDVLACLPRPETATPGYDLVLAAELLVYIGDLAPLFAATASVLRPGGLFAFSTEHLREGSFRLDRTARYQHSRPYIRGLASETGFRVAACEPVDIRKGNDGPAVGDVFVLQSVADGAAPDTVPREDR